MTTKKMLVPKLIFVFLLLSACSVPVSRADSPAASIPKTDHAEGVGQVAPSVSTTVLPQKLHVS
jgi:hypothetical protein